jgi:ADP-ribosylglycohydrolase
MLFEIAIGDAYGAGFEYANENLHLNDLSVYVKHPRHRLQAGSYTDDTQMSIAIAEAVLSDEPWTPKSLADRFVACFKRDPREGYAQGFHDFLVSVRDGGDQRTDERSRGYHGIGTKRQDGRYSA